MGKPVKYVVDGACVMCSQGSAPTTLKATSNSRIGIQLRIVETDTPPKSFNGTFGFCARLNGPCAMANLPKWLNTNANFVSGSGLPCVTKESFLVCTTGAGAIVPVDSGQSFEDFNGLSSIHNRLKEYAAQFSDIDTSKVTWTSEDIAWWKTFGGNEFLKEKKLSFVANYSEVVKDAAKKYDVPEILLAGIMYNEFGGDPMWIDDVAYAVRSFDWSGPNWVDEHLTITNNPNLTSFGNTSIQLRRSYEMFGYDNPSSKQQEEVINSLKNPVENIYMSALHLSDLRNVDYKGKSANELTDAEIGVIATRYNRGPNESLESIQKNTDYGDAILKNKDTISTALDD